ncbi:hypothetical protein G6F42_017978 [Rhizopus arrhizus]|nr:hypothetical protein G6F42_017978 [Rhizopus arrhizus]
MLSDFGKEILGVAEGSSKAKATATSSRKQADKGKKPMRDVSQPVAKSKTKSKNDIFSRLLAKSAATPLMAAVVVEETQESSTSSSSDADYYGLLDVAEGTSEYSHLKYSFVNMTFIDCQLAKIQNKGIKIKVNNGIVSGSTSMTDTGQPLLAITIMPCSSTTLAKQDQCTALEIPKLEENLKVKLTAYLFMMKNWGQEETKGIYLNFTNGDQDALADNIDKIFMQLKQNKLLATNAPDPIKKQNIVLQAATRPGLVRKEHEYIVNDIYPTDITLAQDDSWYDTEYDLTESL